MSESNRKYDAPAAGATLEILEFMVDNPDSWGPTELARQLGLTSNMTFRILNVLIERGYVEKDSAGNCRLTANLLALGMKCQRNFDLRRCAHPWLEELACETQESVQMQIPDGDRMLQFDFVAPPMPFYIVVSVGSRVYWHCNAFGRAVVAFLPEEKQKQILALPTPRLNVHTICDKKLLQEELQKIRSSYCASEFEEYLLGNYCIASPVFNAVSEVVAAVGITGLTSRLDPESLPDLRQKVLNCANKVSHAIGYKEVYPEKNIYQEL